MVSVGAPGDGQCRAGVCQGAGSGAVRAVLLVSSNKTWNLSLALSSKGFLTEESNYKLPLIPGVPMGKGWRKAGLGQQPPPKGCAVILWALGAAGLGVSHDCSKKKGKLPLVWV